MPPVSLDVDTRPIFFLAAAFLPAAKRGFMLSPAGPGLSGAAPAGADAKLPPPVVTDRKASLWRTTRERKKLFENTCPKNLSGAPREQ